jgi:hypothetical protein
MIISVPASPQITNSHWTGAIRCLSTVTASTVTSMGVTITMAVNSPTGINFSPDTAITVLPASKAPRSNCKRGWRIRSSARPCSGNRTRVETSACTRKRIDNIITSVTLAMTYLAVVSRIEKNSPAISI